MMALAPFPAGWSATHVGLGVPDPQHGRSLRLIRAPCDGCEDDVLVVVRNQLRQLAPLARENSAEAKDHGAYLIMPLDPHLDAGSPPPDLDDLEVEVLINLEDRSTSPLKDEPRIRVGDSVQSTKDPASVTLRDARDRAQPFPPTNPLELEIRGGS